MTVRSNCRRERSSAPESKSEPAAKRVIRTVVRAPGTIALDERRISVISMRSESFVLKVADVTTGSHVVKGQPLMEIYSPAVSSAAAEYLDHHYVQDDQRRRSVRTGLPTAADESGRAGCGDLRDREEPERSDLHRVDRPARRHRAGAQRDRGHARPAGRRSVPDRRHSVVWALIDVAERDLGAIAIGQPVTVQGPRLSGRDFSGKIDVDLSGDQQGDADGACSRSSCRIPTLSLLHDMYVDAEIDTGSGEPVLAVPESAVMDTGSRQAVFVDKGRGPLRTARGQARPPRRRLCRDPRRASPTASRWSCRPTS